MLVVACAAWGAAMVWHGQASACSPPQEVLVHVPGEVPQGGLIVGRLQWDDLTTDDLVFRSGDSEVPGTFVAVTAFGDSRFFAFEPDAPLPLSDAGDPESGLFVSVGVGGAVQRVLITEASAEVPSTTGGVTSADVGAGTHHECEEYDPSIYGLCSIPSYSSQTATRAGLELVVEHDSQYFYRATYSVAGGAAGSEVELVGLAEDVSAHWFEGTPAEVCYSLERVALDGTEVLVGEDCLPTAALGLGTVDEIHGDPASTLESCLEPPAGEEERWCDHFAAAIASQSCDGFPTDSCAAALEACDDEGEYTPGTGGADQGGPDTEGSGAASGGDEPGSSGGCSTGPRAPSGAWFGAFALLALSGYARRRYGAVRVR